MIGGSPGESDAIPFIGDPDLDGDFDGLAAFLEHALGSSDATFNHGPDVSEDAFGHLLLDYRRNLAADDVIYEVQYSSDMTQWEAVGGEFEFAGESANGDGTSSVVWRSTAPFPSLRGFIRLQVRAR